MKTLSIRQPWAHMITDFPGTDITPPKRIENRKTLKNILGPFLVHAGLKFDHDGLAWLYKLAIEREDEGFQIPIP